MSTTINNKEEKEKLEQKERARLKSCPAARFYTGVEQLYKLIKQDGGESYWSFYDEIFLHLATVEGLKCYWKEPPVFEHVVWLK